MNKVSSIIGTIYAQGLIHSECAKLCKDANLCGDLAQEVAMVMLDKPSALIQGLNERGELLYYIHRVAKNQYCSKTSPFYHKFVELQNRSEEYDTTL